MPRIHPLLLVAALTALAGCSSAPSATSPSATATTRHADLPAILLHACRRQSVYVKLDLPQFVPGMTIDIASDGTLPLDAFSAFSAHILRGTATGPSVDQLTGRPGIATDSGSYLVPIPGEQVATSRRFTLAEPAPVYLRVDVPPAQDTGTYDFTLTVQGPKAADVLSKTLEIDVPDIALPTEPRILCVATTNTDDLTRIFPESFGPLNAIYLDRADPADHAAVQQLDLLVQTAKRDGIALFVEDVGPRVRVDEVGRVSLDWDAYDRLMQPYMDGTAFADRLPLQTWLAPIPPRRIRDTPTQLRQYMAACVEHFSEKGWVATPVFMHPAMVEPLGDEARDPALQLAIAQTMQLHLSRDMLAVTTPDAAIDHSRLWVVDDSDPRLPPAGLLATEQSVREWPWMCAGRGVKGFVWRRAVAGAAQLRQTVTAASFDDSRRPLLVALNDAPLPATQTDKDKDKDKDKAPPEPQPRAILPTLRLTALSQGIEDTDLLGLLEHRTDPVIVSEVLGGLVGRTGLSAAPPPGAVLPAAAPGYLYAGWPTDKTIWDAVQGMLQKLILSNDPGHRVSFSSNDPLYLATKLWLAQVHRPVARISGYRFNLRPGGDGPVLDMAMLLHAENPVGMAVETQSDIEVLPGDLKFVPDRPGLPPAETPDGTIVAHGVRRVLLPVAGHLDSLITLEPSVVAVTEKTGGAVLRFPVNLPILRALAVKAPPKIDGLGEDWLPARPGTVYGPMNVGTRYLTRPELLAGTVRHEARPATLQWTYDADYLYLLARCPQDTVTDERNTEWPAQGPAGAQRWWGSDGLQVQLASLSTGNGAPGTIYDVAFKPGGVLLVRTTRTSGDGAPVRWSQPEAVTGISYGIVIDKTDGRVRGYTVEAAIPRKWVDDPAAPAGAPPAWRINVLRHRASDLVSASWSGPLASDDDVALLGILIGTP